MIAFNSLIMEGLREEMLIARFPNADLDELVAMARSRWIGLLLLQTVGVDAAA